MESKIDYEITDSELIMKVRECDDASKDFLYERYAPLIHKEINRVKKRAFSLGIDMADLTQEAMLAFSHALNNYKDEEDTKFITFATVCIRRKLLNYIAKYDTNKNKAYSDSVKLDTMLDGNKVLVDQLEEVVNNDPLNRMINYETLSELKKIIEENLSENERLALKYDTMGKSPKEIADIMGMNTKQIYNLIHRARNKLKS